VREREGGGGDLQREEGSRRWRPPEREREGGGGLQRERGRRRNLQRERGRSHFTSTDFGRNASISASPSALGDAKDAEEEEELGAEEEAAALGRLYM